LRKTNIITWFIYNSRHWWGKWGYNLPNQRKAICSGWRPELERTRCWHIPLKQARQRKPSCYAYRQRLSTYFEP
jgi:hypothetical protein